MRNGVGIVMKNSVAKSMVGFWAISDRVIMMKLEAKPFNIYVMQVYAPTQHHDGEEIEKFCQEIQNDIKYAKSDEVICIMGDLNAKVGDERYQNIIGMHGLGQRNERGEQLIQFWQKISYSLQIRGSNNQLENYTHGKVKVLETYHEIK